MEQKLLEIKKHQRGSKKAATEIVALQKNLKISLMRRSMADKRHVVWITAIRAWAIAIVVWIATVRTNLPPTQSFIRGLHLTINSIFRYPTDTDGITTER